MKINLPSDIESLQALECVLRDKKAAIEAELKSIKVQLNDLRDKVKSLMTPLDYWANFCRDFINKNGIPKPKAIPMILEMEDFKSTGITETELDNAVNAIFEKEKRQIIQAMLKKLGKE